MENYIGVIAKVLDPDLFTVEVDIPGENERLRAFPFRGEVDEPRVGDVVFLKDLDPVYHSYYLYAKLKENDFIGMRARGKKVWIKEDFIQIGIIPPDANNSADADEFPKTVAGEWYDDNSGADPTPECTSWVKIDKEGNLEIEMEGGGKVHITADHEVKIDGNWKVEVGGNTEVKIGGNAEVKVSGNTTVESSGNCDIKANGSCTIDSPDVKITGAKATIAGTPTPEGRGALCAIPFCCFTGAPQSSSQSLGN